MGWRLPSYRTADCCPGLQCHSGYSRQRPCWGQTTVVDEWGSEETYWVHACEGHAEIVCAVGGYKSSDRPEDVGVQPREDDDQVFLKEFKENDSNDQA